MLGLILIAIPLFLAVPTLFFRGKGAVVSTRLVAMILLGMAGLTVWSYWWHEGSSCWLECSFSWLPSLGVDLAFKVDGLAKLMLLLVLGIGSAVFAYASGYLEDDENLNRFSSILLVFLAGMLGIVVSDNLILLFVFWEMTSLTSYLLIGYYHLEEKARWHALQALLVTGLGGVVMLLGFVLLGWIGGSFSISELIENRETIVAHPMLPGVIVCLLLGAFTKSGQFPFHFWLPNAMSAPTPVSAFLHSATMVKAGVFLVARLTPLFGGVALWDVSLVMVGGLTMIVTALMGLTQIDLKKILAYTTLSVLGLLMMLLGAGSDLALKTAVVFLLGHALYKSTLFMCAGTVDHAAHTRDVRKIGGLFSLMPITAVAAGLAALSSAGFPPFFGFIGKEYVYKSGFGSDFLGPYILGVAFLSNMLLMALAFKAGIHPFWHSTKSGPTHPKAHDPVLWMSMGPLMLAIAGLLAGALPGPVSRYLVEPAVQSVVGHPLSVELKLWHGINPPLLLSVLTLLGGATIYWLRHRIWKRKSDKTFVDPCELAFEKGYYGLLKFAKKSTLAIQSGSLRQYFLWILLTFIVISAWKWVSLGQLPGIVIRTPVNAMDLAVVGMMLAGTWFALTAKSRLVVLLSLGLVGYGIAWIFAAFGATDLAITQILVETLVVVIFIYCVRGLSKIHQYTPALSRIRDIVIALLSGFFMTLLVLKSQWVQMGPSISEKLMEWSYPLAKGKNVVNVILVDFRALDTMGEVTVLAIAALGVFILLVAGRKGGVVK
jgi:multicomponent Na+:H+ antiporter subunit A